MHPRLAHNRVLKGVVSKIPISKNLLLPQGPGQDNVEEDW